MYIIWSVLFTLVSFWHLHYYYSYSFLSNYADTLLGFQWPWINHWMRRIHQAAFPNLCMCILTNPQLHALGISRWSNWPIYFQIRWMFGQVDMALLHKTPRYMLLKIPLLFLSFKMFNSSIVTIQCYISFKYTV